VKHGYKQLLLQRDEESLLLVTLLIRESAYNIALFPSLIIISKQLGLRFHSFIVFSTCASSSRDLKIHAQHDAFLSKTMTHQDPKPGGKEQSPTRQDLEPGLSQMNSDLLTQDGRELRNIHR
jgi:hypothetical protein